MRVATGTWSQNLPAKGGEVTLEWLGPAMFVFVLILLVLVSKLNFESGSF